MPFITSVGIAHTQSSSVIAGPPAFWLASTTVCQTPLQDRLHSVQSVSHCLTSWTGWSYSFKGALAKAPKYQDLDGFNKDRNGLFCIHVHIDELGFVWVNLDSNTTPGVSWNEDFQAVDCQPRLENFDFSQYHFDHQWEMLGEYNWKTLADNYNEVSY